MEEIYLNLKKIDRFNPDTIFSTNFSLFCHTCGTREDVYLHLYLMNRMKRLDKLSTNALIRLWIEAENR